MGSHSRKGTLNQSGKFGFDLLQPLPPFLIQILLRLARQTETPIKAIGNLDVRNLLPQLSNAFDYGALVHGMGARTLLRVREMRGEKPVVKR
jgi:hypothetical protein